jgi:hypothetical protein
LLDLPSIPPSDWTGEVDAALASIPSALASGQIQDSKPGKNPSSGPPPRAQIEGKLGAIICSDPKHEACEEKISERPTQIPDLSIPYEKQNEGLQDRMCRYLKTMSDSENSSPPPTYSKEQTVEFWEREIQSIEGLTLRLVSGWVLIELYLWYQTLFSAAETLRASNYKREVKPVCMVSVSERMNGELAKLDRWWALAQANKRQARLANKRQAKVGRGSMGSTSPGNPNDDTESDSESDGDGDSDDVHVEHF